MCRPCLVLAGKAEAAFIEDPRVDHVAPTRNLAALGHRNERGRHDGRANERHP